VDARTTIPQFDAYLTRRLELKATVIGGAALQLMGIIVRPTNDCDVLDPTLSPEIVGAADDFVRLHPESNLSLGGLKNGPASLLRTLPKEWTARRVPLYRGTAIELLTLAREDLLRSKLFALLDRNIDLPDCVAMRPAREELQALLPWLYEQDSNPEWPRYVDEVLGQLARELGYEL
jgi:hypothetical protein